MVWDNFARTIRHFLRPYTPSISIVRDWQDSAPQVLDANGVLIAVIYWKPEEMDMIRDVGRQVEEYLVSHKIWRGELNVCL